MSFDNYFDRYVNESFKGKMQYPSIDKAKNKRDEKTRINLKIRDLIEMCINNKLIITKRPMGFSEYISEIFEDIWKHGTIEYKNKKMDSRLFCLRFIAYCRDPRSVGLGLRDNGRLLWHWLLENHSKVFNYNFEWLIREGCRLDDLLYLEQQGLQKVAQQLEIDQNIVVTTVYHQCIQQRDNKKFVPDAKLTKLLEKQLPEIQANRGDLDRFINYAIEQLIEQKCSFRGRPISLIGKWAPTAGCSLDRKTGIVRKLIKLMGITERQYRRMYLTPLRKYLDIKESKMCTNDWENIDVSKIPLRSLDKTIKIMEKHVPSDKMDEIKNSLNEKLNENDDNEETIDEEDSDENHEIMKAIKLIKYYLGNPLTINPEIETQWSNFISNFKKFNNNIFGQESMVVLDTSGSMADKSLDLGIFLTLLSINNTSKNDSDGQSYDEETVKIEQNNCFETPPMTYDDDDEKKELKLNVKEVTDIYNADFDGSDFDRPEDLPELEDVAKINDNKIKIPKIDKNSDVMTDAEFEKYLKQMETETLKEETEQIKEKPEQIKEKPEETKDDNIEDKKDDNIEDIKDDNEGDVKTIEELDNQYDSADENIEKN